MVLAKSTSAARVNGATLALPASSSRTDWQISVDQGKSVRASVISIGSEAAKITDKYKHGRVLAVFDRSFYVQCDQKVICIGVASLGRGPLQILIASTRDVLPFMILSGRSIRFDVHSPQDGGGFIFNRCDLTEDRQARFYSGKVSGRALVSDSIQAIKGALTLLVPPPQQTGFGWMPASIDWQYRDSDTLIATTRTANPWIASAGIASAGIANTGSGTIDASLVRHSLPALKSLYHWLESALRMPAKECQQSISQLHTLMGAGPGLTPSGDDLLAGVMLALHRLQRADLAESLWRELEPHMLNRTNAISGAHLRMAALGQCSELILSLLACLFKDAVFNETGCHNTADAQLMATDIQLQANSIGASSGWDMLAGMSMVLHAL